MTTYQLEDAHQILADAGHDAELWTHSDEPVLAVIIDRGPDGTPTGYVLYPGPVTRNQLVTCVAWATPTTAAWTVATDDATLPNVYGAYATFTEAYDVARSRHYTAAGVYMWDTARMVWQLEPNGLRLLR